MYLRLDKSGSKVQIHVQMLISITVPDLSSLSSYYYCYIATSESPERKEREMAQGEVGSWKDKLTSIGTHAQSQSLTLLFTLSTGARLIAVIDVHVGDRRDCIQKCVPFRPNWIILTLTTYYLLYLSFLLDYPSSFFDYYYDY